ncbi:unnamed protein product [Anisakis simplex]|uniref:CRC domain-containing protein n=1 Tax=Anisakis simplex TaxID=6269 RepID=A0A0M3JZB1_ANISI|nr:unnamed protein product [Anisakis simplex]
MDHNQQLVQEEIVEEVIDDGTAQLYEEMIEVEDGEEVLLEEVEAISVDGTDYEHIPGADGTYQYVVQSTTAGTPRLQTVVTSVGSSNSAPQHHSRLPVVRSNAVYSSISGVPQQSTATQHQQQNSRPLNSQHMYAIRGNQFYRLDKLGSSSGTGSMNVSNVGGMLHHRPIVQMVQRGGNPSSGTTSTPTTNENILPIRHHHHLNSQQQQQQQSQQGIREPFVVQSSLQRSGTSSSSSYYLPMLQHSSSSVNRTSTSSHPLTQSEPRIPIAYHSSTETPVNAYQQNRLLTPFLAARMVQQQQQKKRQSGIGMKKPCNCTKSMCLKLYCDCFANGEFCKDCNCKDCHNNLENEAERSRAIKASLERNPNAFKPKIGVASRGRVDSERLHQKGCHCKKSNCLKNYCECYEAKVPCTERCKCTSCQNTENDRAARMRGKFGHGVSAEMRQLTSSSQSSSEARTSSPFSDDESDVESPEPSDPKTLPWFYMTDEVVEAATLCLVAQAEELESSESAVSDEQLERAVLQEFGRCLGQMIENASKKTNGAVVH